jgi:hypothetical protein
MKCLVWTLLIVASGFSSLLNAAQLKDVKSVYLLPMVGGMDQHLANQLTQDHLLQVVSDPKLADALITDNIGPSFEYKLEHINQPKPAATTTGTSPTEAEPHASTFSRGRGTVFLVDTKSKQVLWSAYQKPKNTTPRELERTAKKVIMNLSDAVNPPVPKK